MNCAEFERKLEQSALAPATAPEGAALAAHGAACARCGSLLAALQGSADMRTPSQQEAFVTSLLQRTSGSACARAQTALPAWVDGELAGDDHDLVALHVEHCPGCTDLAAALRGLGVDLPALASVEPDARFTADVITTTRALGRRRSSPAARWLQGWRQLLVRPRFAWEFATAACSLLTLFYALPSSPLRPVPQRALAMVRVDAGGLLQAAGVRLEPVASDLAGRAWQASGGRVHGAARRRAAAFAGEHAETVKAWHAVQVDLAEVGAGIKSRNLAQMSAALQELGGSVRALFQGSAATAVPGEP